MADEGQRVGTVRLPVAGRNLTQAEWRAVLPNRSFMRVCPGSGRSLPREQPAVGARLWSTGSFRHMRVIVRAVPIVLALLVASGTVPAAAAGHRSRPHCAVRRGYRIVGKDSQAVVVATGNRGGVTWDYCLRSSGRCRGTGA